MSSRDAGAIIVAMAASLVDRFGARAGAVAMIQLRMAGDAPGRMSDIWRSILRSIEDRPSAVSHHIVASDGMDGASPRAASMLPPTQRFRS